MEDFTLNTLLEELVARKGSDLHVKVGSPPTFRINGTLVGREGPPLMPDDIKRLLKVAMTDEQRKELMRNRDLDFAISVPGVSRFRASVFIQRGTVVGVFRAIPFEVPRLGDLNLPPICLELANRKAGLVLVTGATGSGKSTTLAAMIDHINRSRRVHIITLEDPIEFIHRDREALVNQRQVGLDSPSFSGGVVRAMRQDPDVILIGEMRDLETIESALTAAETGHLVLATLHTSGAIQTADRILDVFPADKQPQVRLQLASSLEGILSQHLLVGAQGGRSAVVEVLVATGAVRSQIREGKTHLLTSAMQSGRAVGMQTLEMALDESVKQGRIAPQTAVEFKTALAQSGKARMT
jgi:twitching motility protein PilT